jgi:opacity protein-like surface antigen
MARITASLVVALLLAAPTYAQDPDKKVNLNIGGGYTVTTGEVRDHLGDGYNFHVGMIFKTSDAIGIQAEYSFNGLGKKQVSIPVSVNPTSSSVPTDFFADMNMQFVDFNIIATPRLQGKAAPYFIGGMGVYYRPVKVTSPGIGFVPGYCDPFWYVCYPGGAVPVDNIIGKRSSTDFGVDFGGGVNMPIHAAASFYVEARYHYIWGPSITNPVTNESKKANGQFFPITVGVRF